MAKKKVIEIVELNVRVGFDVEKGVDQTETIYLTSTEAEALLQKHVDRLTYTQARKFCKSFKS